MATSKKTTGKARARKNAPAPQTAPDKGAWREVVGIVLIGIGLVLAYFVILGGDTPAGKAVSAVLAGISGVLRYVVPPLIIWVGVLVAFSGRERRIRLPRVFLVVMLMLVVCAFIHTFVFERIIQQLRVYTFPNFVAQSYQYQLGGAGVLGAILSWPLYYSMGLGLAGTMIMLIILAIADLVLLGKISLRKVGARVQQGYEGMREQAQQRSITRAEQIRVDELPKTNKRGAAKAKADLDELEMWPDDEARLPAPEPAKKPQPKVLTEVTIPKFTPKGQPIKKPSSIRNIDPIEAEDPDGESEVPAFLLKGAKKPRTDAIQPNIREPKLFDPTVPEEPLDERVVSGGMQFPLDGLDQWQEMSIGDALYDEDELKQDVPAEDDEPPFDISEPTLEIPTGTGALPVAKPAPKPDPAPRTAAAMPVATPAKKLERKPEALDEPYNYPPIDLLSASTPSKVKNQEQKDEEKARTLLQTLQSFGISARLIGIAHGPTVTRFELSPAAGIKVSRITALADDIALNLAAISVRIEAPIPGKAAVGVEVPNDVVEIVPLRDVLESNEARRHPSRLATALGRDNAGRYIVADLAKMPHVLIAGATGAGKSVCINAIICSILYRATPEEVRLIMIDPKVVELSAYNGIPHLLVPVVTDPKKAAGALEWAVQEMTGRYKKFAELGVRDMKGYNQRRPKDEPAMAQIVIIIDELADLMMVTPGEVEDAICRLAQLARAAGIHLVIATQRPSVNVITGVIKANIPSRIAFTVASQVDSRTILDVGGAEKLLGRGDMLFAPSGSNKPARVQGAWVSDDEVHAVVEYIKDLHQANYDEDLKEHMEQAELSDAEKDDQRENYDDELLPQAIEIAVEAGQASISMLQRRLRVGYARAGRLVDEMAARGVISQAEGAKPREVLMSREEYRMKFED